MRPMALTHAAQAVDGSTISPPELQCLLDGPDAATREAAWTSLVQSHNRLILHAARSVVADYDAAMDAYAYVLECLREDDFHRLRTFAADGRSAFGTWLVVVARRLCIDRHRHRYGRVPRGAHDVVSAERERAARRRLLDLTASPIEAIELADEDAAAADSQLCTVELYHALDVALTGLTPEDRVLLKLRFEDSLSAQQIAAALGWPTPFHVYRRLNALYAELRRLLAARGVTSSAP
jgi:RNA polymerase sigma factor (sigma-70 family)